MDKKIQLAIIASVLFLGNFVDAGSRVCKRKSLFGKIRFTCPEPGQSPDLLYCCGDDDDIGGQYCCRRNLVIGDGTLISAGDIGSIIGTLVGILGFILILLIICCCVCPCCLLYKRRNRGEGGRVYRSPEANVTVVPVQERVQQSMPSQPPPIGFVPQYPNHAEAYPLQQNYAPYPQPYNNASAAFYPPQPPHQNYDQPPPPYAGAGFQQEAYPKQSPYNPGY